MDLGSIGQKCREVQFRQISSSTRSKKRNRVHKSVLIITVECNILIVKDDHVIRAYGIQIIDRNGFAGRVQFEDAVLAGLAIALVRASDAVVVEEAVQSRTVEEKVFGVNDA
nr:hypothetical protein CFP56_72809 [Quercus suber]